LHERFSWGVCPGGVEILVIIRRNLVGYDPAADPFYNEKRMNFVPNFGKSKAGFERNKAVGKNVALASSWWKESDFRWAFGRGDWPVSSITLARRVIPRITPGQDFSYPFSH
jgi:hypothetical protein